MTTSDDLHQLQIIEDLHEAMSPCDSPGQKVEVSGDMICDAMDTIIELRAKLSTQEAIIEKLPVFADTGQPFIPANTVEVFTVMAGEIHYVTPLCRLGYAWCNGPYYSTEAAAEAARATEGSE